MQFNIIAFLDEGYELGILLPANGQHSYHGKLTNHFSYDGNTIGGFYTDKDPEKILRIILLIKEKYLRTHGGREHLQLLGLVIERKLLTEPYAVWRRAYQTTLKQEPDKYIGLREWLAEHGHPYPHDDCDW